MSIEVSRLSDQSNVHDVEIWEVHLTAVAGSAYPCGWDRRCPVYRFETNAAAEAFVRLKLESASSGDEGGRIEIRSVAAQQA